MAHPRTIFLWIPNIALALLLGACEVLTGEDEYDGAALPDNTPSNNGEEDAGDDARDDADDDTGSSNNNNNNNSNNSNNSNDEDASSNNNNEEPDADEPDADPDGPVAERVRAADQMPQVLVPAGSFTMGSDDRNTNERPARRVTISADFWLDRHEVTAARWDACVQAGACDPTDASDHRVEPVCTWKQEGQDRLPMNCLVWEGAADYCAWVGGALPSEAQWEYAARGPEARTYPWGEGWDCDKAWASQLGRCERDKVTRVESLPKGRSFFGASDMSGNVREFVLDFYVSDAYAQLPDTDPVYTMDTRSRVHRGGGFSDQLENATRAAFRERGLSGARLGYLGFRCVGGEAE